MHMCFSAEGEDSRGRNPGKEALAAARYFMDVPLHPKLGLEMLLTRRIATVIKGPTPVADKKLAASRRSTRRQEVQVKDGDTNVHSRVAANAKDFLQLEGATWRTALFADENAIEPCPVRNE